MADQVARPAAPDVNLRAVVFDIETMPNNFMAESELDILVCASFLPLDTEKPYTIAITHPEMTGLDDIDYRALRDLVSELEKFDILIGHNIAAYDLNWILTRLMYYGIPFPQKRHLYYDTYSASKRIAIKTWKNLGNLGAFFGANGEKTKIHRPDWAKLWTTNKKQFDTTMNTIVYHCEQDVILNRQVFNELWATDHKATNLPFFRKW